MRLWVLFKFYEEYLGFGVLSVCFTKQPTRLGSNQIVTCLLWAVVPMSVQFSKSLQYYLNLFYTFISQGPIWYLEGCLTHKVFISFGMLFRRDPYCMTQGDPNNLYNTQDPFLEFHPMNCSPMDTLVLPLPILPLWSSVYNVLWFLKKGMYLGPRIRRIKKVKSNRDSSPLFWPYFLWSERRNPLLIFFFF